MHVRDDERTHRLRQRTRARDSSQMRVAPAQASAQDSNPSSNEDKEGHVVYRLMGWMHVRIVDAWGEQRGQGTVEYVALILLVAALLAGVVAATRGTKFGTGGIAETIVSQIKSALGKLR
jgi:hypothetical protein